MLDTAAGHRRPHPACDVTAWLLVRKSNEKGPQSSRIIVILGWRVERSQKYKQLQLPLKLFFIFFYFLGGGGVLEIVYFLKNKK